MDLDLHQLELRYEALRKRSPRLERQLVASLSEVGQQLPIVVVGAGKGRFVVIDGYKRVRALRRLSRDTVKATAWVALIRFSGHMVKGRYRVPHEPTVKEAAFS